MHLEDAASINTFSYLWDMVLCRYFSPPKKKKKIKKTLFFWCLREKRLSFFKLILSSHLSQFSGSCPVRCIKKHQNGDEKLLCFNWTLLWNCNHVARFLTEVTWIARQSVSSSHCVTHGLFTELTKKISVFGTGKPSSVTCFIHMKKELGWRLLH